MHGIWEVRISTERRGGKSTPQSALAITTPDGMLCSESNEVIIEYRTVVLSLTCLTPAICVQYTENKVLFGFDRLEGINIRRKWSKNGQIKGKKQGNRIRAKNVFPTMC